MNDKSNFIEKASLFIQKNDEYAKIIPNGFIDKASEFMVDFLEEELGELDEQNIFLKKENEILLSICNKILNNYLESIGVYDESLRKEYKDLMEDLHVLLTKIKIKDGYIQ